MADDVLRLAAEVTDRFTKPMVDLQRQMRAFADEQKKLQGGAKVHADEHGKALKLLHGEVDQFGKTVKATLAPALAEIGVKSLTFAGAVAAVTNATVGFGSKVRELKTTADLSDISVGAVKAIESWARAKGAQDGAMDEMLRNMGAAKQKMRINAQDPVNVALYRMKKGEIAEAIKNAKNGSEQFRIEMQAIADETSPNVKQMLAEQFHIPLEVALELNSKTLPEALNKFFNTVVSQEYVDRGIAMDAAFKSMKVSLMAVKDTIGYAFSPAITQDMKNLADVVHALNAGIQALDASSFNKWFGSGMGTPATAAGAPAVGRALGTGPGSTPISPQNFEHLFPDAPPMATGGYIDRDQIMKLHAGERVLTASQVSGQGGGGSSDMRKSVDVIAVGTRKGVYDGMIDFQQYLNGEKGGGFQKAAFTTGGDGGGGGGGGAGAGGPGGGGGGGAGGFHGGDASGPGEAPSGPPGATTTPEPGAQPSAGGPVGVQGLPGTQSGPAVSPGGAVGPGGGGPTGTAGVQGLPGGPSGPAVHGPGPAAAVGPNGEATPTGDARLTTAGSYQSGGDTRRTTLMAAAAEASKNLPPGWRVEAFSGHRTGAHSAEHGPHAAIDFRLIDPQGHALPDYQNPNSFATYEKFAQDTHLALQKIDPQLAAQHRWGGYFSGTLGKGGTYGAMDEMHQDFHGGDARMAAGKWGTGLDKEWRQRWGVSNSSAGIGTTRPAAPAVGAATPTSPAAANPAVAGLRGSAFLKAQRARFAAEAADPKTRAELRAVAYTETGDDPRNAIEALANRSAAYDTVGQHKTIHQLLGWDTPGRWRKGKWEPHSGFFGPINRGHVLEGGRRDVEGNAALKAQMEGGIVAVEGGSNILKGYTDQGGLADPNAGHFPRMVWPHGEVNNDWGGGLGWAGNKRFREEQQRQVAAGGDAVTGPGPVAGQAPTPAAADDIGVVHRGPAYMRSRWASGAHAWTRGTSSGELIKAHASAGANDQTIKGNADVHIKLAEPKKSHIDFGHRTPVNRGKTPDAVGPQGTFA